MVQSREYIIVWSGEQSPYFTWYWLVLPFPPYFAYVALVHLSSVRDFALRVHSFLVSSVLGSRVCPILVLLWLLSAYLNSLGSSFSYWEFLPLGIRVVSSRLFVYIFSAPHWFPLRSAYCCIGLFALEFFLVLFALAFERIGSPHIVWEFLSDAVHYIIVVALVLALAQVLSPLATGICVLQKALTHADLALTSGTPLQL
jgi:hypothetical protein